MVINEIEKYIDRLGISEILTEFREDIRDIIKESEIEELTEKKFDSITFQDLIDYDIALEIEETSYSSEYCNVYTDIKNENLVLFYRQDYLKMEELENAIKESFKL